MRFAGLGAVIFGFCVQLAVEAQNPPRPAANLCPSTQKEKNGKCYTNVGSEPMCAAGTGVLTPTPVGKRCMKVLPFDDCGESATAEGQYCKAKVAIPKTMQCPNGFEINGNQMCTRTGVERECPYSTDPANPRVCSAPVTDAIPVCRLLSMTVQDGKCRDVREVDPTATCLKNYILLGGKCVQNYGTKVCAEGVESGGMCKASVAKREFCSESYRMIPKRGTKVCYKRVTDPVVCPQGKYSPALKQCIGSPPNEMPRCNGDFRLRENKGVKSCQKLLMATPQFGCPPDETIAADGMCEKMVIKQCPLGSNCGQLSIDPIYMCPSGYTRVDKYNYSTFTSLAEAEQGKAGEGSMCIKLTLENPVNHVCPDPAVRPVGGKCASQLKVQECGPDCVTVYDIARKACKRGYVQSSTTCQLMTPAGCQGERDGTECKEATIPPCPPRSALIEDKCYPEVVTTPRKP